MKYTRETSSQKEKKKTKDQENQKN
jgi:hypothetical protein